MKEEIAYLGLGANVGDREANLQNALRLLSESPGLRLLRCSQVYETEPWGVTGQPEFLNCCAEFAVSVEPEALLAVCKEVESVLGRLPGPRWGPRLIDVDILLHGERRVALPDLEIPHPRLHLRAFALVPLAELNAAARHAGMGRTIAELASGVEGLDGVRPAGEIGLTPGSSDC